MANVAWNLTEVLIIKGKCERSFVVYFGNISRDTER